MASTSSSRRNTATRPPRALRRAARTVGALLASTALLGGAACGNAPAPEPVAPNNGYTASPGASGQAPSATSEASATSAASEEAAAALVLPRPTTTTTATPAPERREQPEPGEDREQPEPREEPEPREDREQREARQQQQPREPATVTVTVLPRETDAQAPDPVPEDDAVVTQTDVSRHDSYWFRTPSKNITCLMSAPDGPTRDATVRCTIIAKDWHSPAKPDDCPLDWGNDLNIDGNGTPGFVCAGDTVLGASTTVDYGTRLLMKPGLTCTVTTDGVTCASRFTNDGFFLSREKYRLF